MVSKMALFGIIGLFIVVLISCGTSQPTPTPKPMTIVEYAAAVCDPVDLPDSATWRQARAKLQADIDRTKGINPPTAVRDYHLAAVAAIKETLDATVDLDQDALVNTYELLDNEGFMTKALVLEGVTEGLDPETRQILQTAGCDIE